MDFKALLVLACVAVGSFAGPVFVRQCAKQCESDENGIFEPSKTYYYEYEVTVDSRIDGGISEQSSKFMVRAMAAIEALSRCEMVLKLSSITITEKRQDGTMGSPDTATSFSSALEANQLRFGMESDGRITAVCPETTEMTWTLNIKRGLLSAIQTRRAEAGIGFADVGVMETDVTGTCETNYESSGDNVVIKTKDFVICKNRTSLNMFIDAIPVHEFAPTASPMSSQQVCRARMDTNGLNSVTCTETHTMKPFAQSESKPVTSVISHLRRSQIVFDTLSSLSDPFDRQSCLIYEDAHHHADASSNDVLDTLTQICDSVINGVGLETPSLFERLTQQLGYLDADDMSTVVHKLFRICPEASATARKDVTNMVKDALIDCDSEQCADGFKTIVNTQNSAQNDFYREKWFMKLVFHKNPTKSMILIVNRQLRGSTNMNVHAYYALSSMIYHYCMNSETDCTRDDDIMNAASIFEDNLHESCLPESEEEEKKMLMSLRAIGNMGVINDKALIYRCNRDRNVFKLRIASLEAFRRIPCEKVPTDRFMRIFTTVDNDAELRIAAYRAIMRCPTEDLLDAITHTLTIEPTQQVTCYVSSHLANLRATQNPLLHDLQELLRQSPLINITECNMDIRKFSHNYAFSRFHAESGNGINIDSDLIFSSKSYLPRSFRLDTSVDIFGYSLDLFQFGARMEGMQELLESNLAMSPEDKENSMLSHFKHIMKKRSQRQRREGVKAASINKIKTKYLQNHLEPEDTEEAAISMKIFNNDVFYKDQEDFKAMAAKFQSDQIMMIIAALSQQRTYEYNLNKNFKPSTARIPTIAGLPLQVDIKGGLTSTLKASGKLDVLGMAVKPRRMDLMGSVEPSAAVEVHSTMMVDAHCAHSGLTHKTSMASSFSIGGSVFFEHGMLKVKVNAPDRRQTIINASSSLYFMQSNKLIPVAEPEDAINTVHKILNNSQYQMNISGSRPNARLSLPESLYRTWKISISLDKLDETLATYNLEGGYQVEKVFKNGLIQVTDRVHVMVGTPDTMIPATYLVDLAFHRANNSLGIHVLTPISDTYFTGSLRNESTHKNIHLHVAHDGEDYDVQLGLDTIPQENGMKYVPVFHLEIPNIESYRLDGFVTNQSMYNEINLSLLNSNDQKLIAFKGDLIRNDTMKRLALSTSIGTFSVSIEGGYKLNVTSEAVRFTPIFSVSSIPQIGSLSLESSPVVISSTGVSIDNVHLATSTLRLVEISKLRFDNTSSLGLEFKGMLRESIPFGMDFDFTTAIDEDNTVIYNVNLNTTSSFGIYHINGFLKNVTSQSLHTLMINQDINGTDYFSLTVNFKNEISALQYLETIIGYKGEQMFRSKNGLQMEEMATKMRYTPIFILETQLLGGIKLRGSCDVSADRFDLNDITLAAAEDLIILRGGADKNSEVRRVGWSLSLGGKYLQGSLDGSTEYLDNAILFTTTMTCPDGTDTPPSYRLTLDFQNAASEDNILAWFSKVEVDFSHRPEVSFRLDSDYTLMSNRSTGNLFRLCYNGVDCTSTQDRITLHHDLTYARNTDAGTFNKNLIITFRHPAKSRSYALNWVTDCGRDIPSYSMVTMTNNMEPVFDLMMRYIPETTTNNGVLDVSMDIPQLYSVTSTQTWHFMDVNSIYLLSTFQSDDKEMSSEVTYTMSVDPERVLPMTYNFTLRYTDINNTVYALEQYADMESPGNALRITSIRKNDTVVFLYYDKALLQETQDKIHSDSIYVTKTSIIPGVDFSYNITLDILRATNDVALQVYARFMPGQNPITLSANFTNSTTAEKKEGELVTTLHLPTMDITVSSGGKYENGVPSGNISIKFVHPDVDSTFFGIDFLMRNESTVETHNYITEVILVAPSHQARLHHTMLSDKENVLPLTSTLTGGWNGQEVLVNFIAVNDDQYETYNSTLILTIPEHKYLVAFSMPEEFNGFAISLNKDMLPLVVFDSYLINENSAAGITHTLDIDFYLKGQLVDMTFTLANLTTSYSFNANVQNNMEEVVYLNAVVQLFTGQKRFDYNMETRTMYLPGYDTNTIISFEKTDSAVDVTMSVSVDNVEKLSITFNNETVRDNERQRKTYLIIGLPTNPNPLLRNIGIEDRCGMNDEPISHNISLLWGSLLPTQVIELRLKVKDSTNVQGVTLQLVNPGLVLGLSSYNMTMLSTKIGYNRNALISLNRGLVNVFTFETDYKNQSRSVMKNHIVTVSLKRPTKDPIKIVSSLVHNDGNTVLDTDLIITYSLDPNQQLTAGIEVNRAASGHSTELTLRHLVNNIDIFIMGTYVNSSDMFQMTLENNVRLGGMERYQPELSCSLNKNTKQIDIIYTSSGTYEFHGRFTNRSNEDGRIYQINCQNVFNGRNVLYEFLFDEPDRMISARVNYNPENAEDFWEFNSGYFNDTAIYAQLDTSHSGQLIQNASIVLNLTPSKVLLTHIKWEPSWPEDVKAKALDIVNKVKEQANAKRVVISDKWAQLGSTMNATLLRFMAANMDMYTNMVTMKNQVKAQWLLTQPMWLAQLGDMMMKWSRFNTTLHENLENFGANFVLRGKALKADFEDVCAYFKPGFASYAQDVNRTLQVFVRVGSHIKTQFNAEEIVDHYVEYQKAKNAFWEQLFTKYFNDFESMKPDFSLFVAKFQEMNESLIALKEEITTEIMTRINSLKTEKAIWQAKFVPVIIDIMSLNTSLHQAIVARRDFIQQELRAFQNPNFTPYVEFGQLLNHTIHATLSQLDMQMKVIGAQFMAPYMYLIMMPQRRLIRQAPQPNYESTHQPSNLQFSHIKRALAQLNGRYVSPNAQEVTSDEQPTHLLELMTDPEVNISVEVSNMVQVSVQNALKCIYELVKYDLENGEIIVKIFLKPNFTESWQNTTWQNATAYIVHKISERVDGLEELYVSILRLLREILNEEAISKYRQRFQERFEAFKSEIEEMSESLQTQVQQAVQTRLRPYMERLNDLGSQRSRPFFGRQFSEMTEQQSFLTELQNEIDYSAIKHVFGKMKQQMCGVYNKISSAFVIVKKATCLRQWMPPYSTNALLVGPKHYMTFDQQFYDFSGKCGYLLAQDFVHENDFSAVVDYDREMDVLVRNTMFIINSTTFEIGADGSVLVNRQLRELPFQVDNTIVARIGEAVLLMNSEGISIKCIVPYDVCSMHLTGRYFGRTGGLLGNFNYEMFDDFKTPDNILMNNITSFSDSWKVGKNCRTTTVSSLDRNRVIPSMDSIMNFDPLHLSNQGCASMFLDNCSPLARCHDFVDPDSFYRMCVIDTHNVPEDQHGLKMCSVASAYRTQCFLTGIRLTMPDSCITCDIGNETFDASTPRKLEDEIPNMVDVVIVVEEKLCAEPLASFMDGIVTRLAGELKENDFNDTFFGLAAFGGEGVHDLPHQHTINHAIFTDKPNDFQLGRDSLEFASIGSNDTFAAINLAANYPFRAGVAKHIILLSCSEFRDEHTNMRFSDLSVLLNKRGIKFSLLTNFDFAIRKEMSKIQSKSKAERVYGIDSDAVYTSKMAGQNILKGDRTLREFVNEPNDLCSLLALETNGAIFDSGLLGTKGFDEVFVKRLVKNSEPMPCQVCQCVADPMTGIGQSVCEQCVNPLNPLWHDIRGSIRDFELKFDLPHMRFDSTAEEEE